jgi:type IV secretion system protein VirB3
MDTFDDPIFRGCTRPAMLARVPMLPFLTVTGAFLLLAVWTCYLISAYVALFLVLAYAPLLVTMREMTRKDDQRLHQLMLQLRMRWHQYFARRQWGACTYSPLRYKRRS